MNRSDIDYIIEKLDSYKPDNIYDGCNSVKEKQDQRVSEVLDSIIAEIKSDYANMCTPTPKELVLTLSPKQMEETKEHIDELVKQFVEDIEIKYNWIKCIEKMPEPMRQVLFYDSFHKDYAVGFYNDNYGFLQVGTWVITIGDNEYYTHWRILPEPPEEEEK